MPAKIFTLTGHFSAGVVLLVFLTGCATSKESGRPGRIGRPDVVLPGEWGSKPEPIPEARRHVPRFVTIHHAGVPWKAGRDPAEFLRSMQAWGQRDKGWPDLPYHFLIAPDGRIFAGRPLMYEPESNTRYELSGNIGVELMGDFYKTRPTPAQLKSLVQLVASLCADMSIDVNLVRGHRDVAPGQTTCPGADLYRYIESGALRGWIREAMGGRKVEIEVGEPLPGGPTTQLSP